MAKLSTVNDHRGQVEAAERRQAAARAGLDGLLAERAALEDLVADGPRRMTVATADAAENPSLPEYADRLRKLRARLAEAPQRLEALPALIAAAEGELAEAVAAVAAAQHAEAAAAVPALKAQRVREAERIDALLAELAGTWATFTGLGGELRGHQDVLGQAAADVDEIYLRDAVKRHVRLALALGMEPDRSFDLGGHNFERRSTERWPALPALAERAAA